MFKTIRSLSVVAATVVALGGAAGTAHAGIAVDDATPTDGQTLTTTISSPPSGAQYYTLAQCDVSSSNADDWALNCNGDTTVGFTPVSTTTNSIVVDQSFTNQAFGGGSPTRPSTSCTAGAGTTHQCGVIVSWYRFTLLPPFVNHLGHEKVDITF